MEPTTTFAWGEDQQKAFDVLKTKLNEAPVLAHPNQDDHPTLVTDASNHSIGAELLKVQDGIEWLTGFGSFMLYPAQLN